LPDVDGRLPAVVLGLLKELRDGQDADLDRSAARWARRLRDGLPKDDWVGALLLPGERQLGERLRKARQTLRALPEPLRPLTGEFLGRLGGAFQKLGEGAGAPPKWSCLAGRSTGSRAPSRPPARIGNCA
jgi:hypothetical protein